MAIEIIRAQPTHPLAATEIVMERLDHHLRCVAGILEDLGQRPFGQLKISMPNMAYDCEVSIFWRDS
jgi:hypothetical protein